MDSEDYVYTTMDDIQMEHCKNLQVRKEDSKYELLDKSQDVIDNVYENTESCKSKQQTTNVTKAATGHEETVDAALEEIKFQPKKVKRSPFIMGFLIVAVLVVSLVAAALAAYTFYQNNADTQVAMKTAMQAQSSQAILVEQLMNYSQLLTSLSNKLQQLQSTVSKEVQRQITTVQGKVDNNTIIANELQVQIGILEVNTTMAMMNYRQSLTSLSNGLQQVQSTVSNEVQRQITTVQGKVDNNTIKANELQVQVGILEVNTTMAMMNYMQSLTSLSNELQQVQSTVSNDVQHQITTVQDKVENNTIKANELQVGVGILEVNATEAQRGLNNLREKLESLQSVAESNATTVRNEINALRSELGSLHRITEYNVTLLRSDIRDVRNQLDYLQTMTENNSTAVRSDIHSLMELVMSVQSAVDTNLTMLNNDFNSLRGRVDSLQSTTENNTAILRRDVWDLSSNFDGFQGAVENNATVLRYDIIGLRGQLSNLHSVVASVNSTVDSLESRLTAAQIDAENNTVSITNSITRIRNDLATVMTTVSNISDWLIGSSGNLFQNCTQENDSCDLTTGLNNNRQLACNTSDFEVDREVSIILS